MKKRSQPIDIFITVALVANNDQKTIKHFVKDVAGQVSKKYKYIEILILDNGSKDKTAEIVQKIQGDVAKIRLISLARQYNLETAYAAILENSLGDFVVILNPKTDPPGVINELVEKALEGYDVVIAESKRKQKLSSFGRLLTKIFNRLFIRTLGVEFVPYFSFTGVFSRAAVNSLVQIRNKKRYLLYSDALRGFHKISLTYKRVRRVNERKDETPLRILVMGLDIIIANSKFPLRVASLLGLIASFLSLSFLIYVFIVSMVKEKVVEGWISMAVVSSSLFFILFTILTVISEYIGRILTEFKDEPLYFISKETSSPTLLDKKEKKKRNVV